MKKGTLVVLVIIVLVVWFLGGFKRLAVAVLPEAIKSSGYSSWYEQGMGSYLPDPTEVFGRSITTSGVFSNSNQHFYASIDSTSQEEYEKYVEACKKCGFTKLIEEGSSWYDLKYPFKGRSLHIRGGGSTILITLER